MSALITPVLAVVWLLVVIAFLTGATHRWLQDRGLTRHVAILIQAVVLSLSFTVLWVSTGPALVPTDQLWLFWIWLFIVAYGSVLIWVRWIRPH
jgi:hypothetical protein